MKSKYFFYKRTVKPVDKDLVYYNYSLGIAGYRLPQRGHSLFHGTMKEYNEFIKHKPKIARSWRLW